jgi:hypothetical protein
MSERPVDRAKGDVPDIAAPMVLQGTGIQGGRGPLQPAIDARRVGVQQASYPDDRSSTGRLQDGQSAPKDADILGPSELLFEPTPL